MIKGVTGERGGQFCAVCKQGWFMLVEKVLSGSRKCDWPAAFGEARQGAGPAIGGNATVDQAAIERCALKNLAFVSVFVYESLDSSQTLKLQTRQAISNFHQKGVRKRRSP